METHHDKVAIVTGAAGGLGGAAVAALQDRGWTVAALDRIAPTADHPYVVDVSDAVSVAQAVGDIVARFGRVDGVAHCAGVFRNNLAPLHLLDDETWSETIGVNLTGSFHIARAVLPALLESKGALTLVASVSATFTQPGGAAYAASKAGVIGLVDAIAVEYGAQGVRCNAVLPGYMATGMAAPLVDRPHLRAEIENEIPLGRIADPSEVAGAVAFTLSPEASYMSGHSLVVDGAAHLTSMTSRRDVDRMWRRTAAAAQAQ